MIFVLSGNRAQFDGWLNHESKKRGVSPSVLEKQCLWIFRAEDVRGRRIFEGQDSIVVVGTFWTGENRRERNRICDEVARAWRGRQAFSWNKNASGSDY